MWLQKLLYEHASFLLFLTMLTVKFNNTYLLGLLKKISEAIIQKFISLT